ncbi:MAG: type I-D CRISPR-associated protein Cas5/Csc1 [Cuniculiplasma sp.]
MKAYKVTLLSPLHYRSRIESGAAGATVTDPWIGDLAMMYAINNTLGLRHIMFRYNSHKPDYREIVGMGFILSVAEPLNSYRFTKVMDISTSFISEGYPQGKAISDSGRAAMRNWMKRQGIEPGSEFYFVSFFESEKDQFPSRFTVRLGNTKECLALVEEEPVKETSKVTVNLYTLSLFLKAERFQEIIADIKDGKYSSHILQASPQYVLAKNITVRNALKIFEPYD